MGKQFIDVVAHNGNFYDLCVSERDARGGERLLDVVELGQCGASRAMSAGQIHAEALGIAEVNDAT